jgi:hypothetical protein
MSVLTERDVIEIKREVSRLWWLFLITGVGWVLVSFMVLLSIVERDDLSLWGL